MFPNDFYYKMQEYSISVLRTNPDYLKLCEIIAGQFDNLQKCSEYVLNATCIDKASGIWLDYIGWLVGTTREYFDITKYFCVNSPDLYEEKFIYFKTQIGTGQSTLQDELFRRRIYAKIGYNTTKARREDNIYIIKNMTFADKVKIEKVEPMVLDITLYGNNIIPTNTLYQDIQNILGTGVGLRNLEIEAA